MLNIYKSKISDSPQNQNNLKEVNIKDVKINTLKSYKTKLNGRLNSWKNVRNRQKRLEQTMKHQLDAQILINKNTRKQ